MSSTANDLNITKRKASEKAIANFSLNKHLLRFLWSEPFYSRILRSITKIEDSNIATAGVLVKDGELFLWYNKSFMASLTDQEIEGLLKHECLHIVFEHTTSRRKEPHMIWNFATDLAINSTIPVCELPQGGLIPGVKFRPLTLAEKEKMTDENIKFHEKFSEIIGNLPPDRTSEFYFEKLMEEEEIQKLVEEAKNGSCENQHGGEGGNKKGDGKGNESGGYGFDDHKHWDELPQEEREMMSEKLKDIVKDAVDEANCKSWGSVSSSAIKTIRKMFSKEIKWEKILAAFCGNKNRNDRYSTHKRLSRKYPGVQPGASKDYKPNIGVYVDESGSMSNRYMEKIYAEIASLSKRTNFYLYRFDAFVDDESGFLWKKGKRVDLSRQLTGGTCFESVVNHVEKNQEKFDAYIIITDGHAPIPRSIRKARCWIIIEERSMTAKSFKAATPRRDVVIGLKP